MRWAPVAAVTVALAAAGCASSSRPDWVDEAVAAVESYYGGEGHGEHVWYAHEPGMDIVTVSFDRQLVCGGCSYPSGGSAVRGRGGTVVLADRTHRLLSFSTCTDFRVCRSEILRRNRRRPKTLRIRRRFVEGARIGAADVSVQLETMQGRVFARRRFAPSRRRALFFRDAPEVFRVRVAPSGQAIRCSRLVDLAQVRPAELTIRVSPSECRIVARGEAP